MKKTFACCALFIVFLTPSAQSEEIDCITTSWKLIGSNHKVCVQAFDDPKVKGVACHISQAKKIPRNSPFPAVRLAPLSLMENCQNQKQHSLKTHPFFLKKLKSPGCLTLNAIPWSMLLSVEN